MSVDNMNEATEEDVKANVQKRNKALLLRSKKKAAILMSPAPGISPKAAPLSYHSPAAQKMLSHSPSLSTLSNQKVSMEQMNRSFEEWMRIAADNKINAKNTWNFALIDYFSELSFLQDGDSINFQKASCTLDGCVKIYSSRVDSVVDETGKLLTGLSDRNDVMLERDNSDSEDDQIVKKKSKRHAKAGDTLEKNPDNLSLRGKIEMEGYTDPLFKKTCAEFDESVGGTLLFNLTLDSKAKVVFDSNCPLIEPGLVSVEDTFVDCQLLAEQFTDLSLFSMTPTVDNYSFLSQTNVIHDHLASALEKLSVDQPDSMEVEDNPFGVPVTVTNEPFNDDGYYEEENIDNIDNRTSVNRVIEEDGFSSNTPFNTFAFLDEPGRMKTTWAGVEHWKIKRIKQHSDVPSTHPQEKVVKKQTEIDFTQTDIDLEHLLSKSSSALTLAQINEKGVETTLPDDLHFSSADLTCLFTKPTWHFSRVKRSVTEDGVREQTEFIATSISVNTLLTNVDDSTNDNIDDRVDFGLATNDDFEDTQESYRQNTIDLSQNIISTQEGKLDALSINYSKRAKRVDVRLLKDSLWSSINSDKKTTISGIISKLPAQYSKKPKEELQDLSVPYAFICLLHLANEHGLQLKEVSNGDLEIQA